MNQSIKIIKIEKNNPKQHEIDNKLPLAHKLQQALDIDFYKTNYYTVDKGSNTISIYNKSYKLISNFGGYGNDNGKFNEPNSILVRDDKIYVSDSLNHRIQQFDVQGRYEKTVIKNLYYPCCIRMNSEKDLFIVDQVKSAIVMVDCKQKDYCLKCVTDENKCIQHEKNDSTQMEQNVNIVNIVIQ